LLKNSEKQIPRGLKPARNDKNKTLAGTTEQAAEKLALAVPIAP
jgi:hypothetical protein